MTFCTPDTPIFGVLGGVQTESSLLTSSGAAVKELHMNASIASPFENSFKPN
jgi:hypothetical protein